MKKIIIATMILMTTSYGYGATNVKNTKTIAIEKTTTANKHEIKVDNRPNYRAYLVADTNGNIIYSQDIDTKYPLASTTKVMTLLVTFEELKKGNVKMDDDVIISARAASKGGSMIPMKVGDVFKLSDLIKATAIHSANNAAYAVAEHVGKGYDNFIKMMNDRAIILGIGDSVEYYTPAGLPPKMTGEKMDMGSARAMYKLILEAEKYPEYIEIAGMKNAKIHNDTINLRSKNHLLGKDGIYGLKTGYHGTSGFNILVLGEQDNLKAAYVLLGGKTAKIRDDEVLALNKKFHENYYAKSILSKDSSVGEITVNKGVKALIKVYPDSDYTAVLKKTDDVSIELDRIKKINAPINTTQNFGTYKVMINGKEVFQGKLLIKENVDKKSFLERITEIF